MEILIKPEPIPPPPVRFDTIKTAREWFAKSAHVLDKMLSKRIPVDTFLSCAFQYFALDKAERGEYGVLACTPLSIIGGMFTAAQLGLPIGPAFGQAWLLPFKKIATFVMGYRGYPVLAGRRDASIRYDVIYATDEFDCTIEPPMIHLKRPREAVRTPDNLIASYAKLIHATGREIQVVLWREELLAKMNRAPSVIKARKLEKTGRDFQPPIWVVDFVAMCAKSAVQVLGSKSDLRDLQRGAILDDQAERGLSQNLELGAADMLALPESFLPEQKERQESKSPIGKERAEQPTTNGQLATIESVIANDQKKQITDLLYAKEFSDREKDQMYESFATWLAEQKLPPRFADIPLALFPEAIAKIKADAITLRSKRRAQ